MTRPLRYTRSELSGSSMVWLLRVDYASRSFVFSSSFVPADSLPTDDDGRPYTLAGSLGDMPEISEAFDLLSSTSSARTLSFRGLVFPVDIAALIEAGHDLGAATGEVSLWRVGDSYSDRLVWLTGPLSQPEYGAQGEPVAFTVEENPFDDLAIVPGGQARASTSSLAAVEVTEVGLYYPIVFGTPGVYTDEAGTAQKIAGTIGVVVARTAGACDTLVIAGHQVAATTARVWSGGTVSESLTVTNSADLLGNAIAQIDLTASSGPIDRSADEFWVTWDGGGGLASDAGALITGGGDLLEWFLSQSSLRVDVGRLAAAKPYLNQYKFSGYVNEAVSPWQWCEVNLMPLLPASVVAGPDGVYPVVWRFDAVAADAVETIDADNGQAVRSGPVSYEAEPIDIRNDFRLDYAPDANTQKAQRFVQLRAAYDSSSTNEIGSYYAEISAGRFGTATSSKACPIIYDEATARAVVSWQVRAYGLLHRSVSYTVPKSYGWLTLGSVVKLTDSDLSLAARVALVQAVRWETEETLTVTLLIVDDPARDI